ncbi:MAG: hypothetical protein H8E86_04930 [Planctomycetes bacterium]|nr:hypothetical protein [Planctomycetota bacterium]
MRHNLVLVVVFLFIGSSAIGQYSLGTGDALESNTSSNGTANAIKSLPIGVRNNALRGNGMLQGINFNGSLGRPNGADVQLIKDAGEEGDSAYQEALYNSPWYWNNWNQQSAQFLKQGDRSYFNPSFMDNWSTSPQTLSEGRSIRTYSNDWNEEGAKEYAAKNDITSSTNWSSRQKEQFRLSQVLGSGSQTPAYDTSSIQVGHHNSKDSIGYLTASPMRGVSLQTSIQPTVALGFSAWDAARATQDEEAGIGNASLVQTWRTAENRLDYGVLENRISVPEQYINILDTIAEKAKQLVDNDEDDETTLSWLDAQYAKLQEELAGIDEEDEIVENETETTEEETLAIDDIYASLQHGERIGTFAGAEQSRFNELVQKGELAIARGEFFLAEKRFDQALMFIPGHPMATAGLGHANLGSGLHLSASHVLQSLFTFQPEMIGVRYEPQLLPTRIDLVRTAVAIRSRLGEERDGGTYAFLLAYIGYQLQDIEMIEQGLTELQNRANEGDPIIPMLEYIWLEGKPMPAEAESQTP